MSNTEMAEQAAAETAILLLAPIGRDAAVSGEVLRQAEIPCAVCANAEELIKSIRRGGGPAVLVAEALSSKHAARLNRVLSDQPTWSDLPLIILAGKDGLPVHLRELVARRNTTLLHRPLKQSTFITVIRSALENRRRQYEVRDLLRRIEYRSQQLQHLALQLTQSEEKERQRLANLLHDDLQQLLVGAKLQVTLLPGRAQQNQLDEATGELLELLDESIRKSRDLSHQLSPPTLRQHGLPAGLRWLAERIQQMHQLQVVLDLDDAADPPDSRIRTFLYRSAQELLFNVVKHAGVAEARLQLAVENEQVILIVQDRGRGIDPRVMEESQSGFGLLSIRERADLLGGRFEVHEDGGSIFTLTMPFQPGTVPAELIEAEAEEMAAPERRDRTASLRILLADDHHAMRSGLRSLLKTEQGLDIVGEANDGTQAVELADQLRPDLVLMDLAMPRMDGIEATHQIKRRHPEIRVIGLSMFEDEQSARKMLEAGAERYLSKTGPNQDLLAAVRGENRQHPSPGE